MIRQFQNEDLDELMKLWIDTNKQAHDFVDASYLNDHYALVKDMLPSADIYVYEDMDQIKGFIGLDDDYIAGIFVSRDVQSQGIGKQLLDYVKNQRNHLSLNVYDKNKKAISFYQRENFVMIEKNIR